MTRLLRSQLALFSLFAVLLMVIRATGSLRQGGWFAGMLAQDAHLSDRGWCWRGLCPAYTSYATVRSEIQRWFPDYESLSLGTVLSWEESRGTQRWSGRVRGIDAEPLAFAQLRPTLNTFTFGDAVFQFGQPSIVQIHGYIGYRTWLIFVYFDNGVYAEMVLGEPRLMPTQPVLSISFDATGETAHPADTYPRRNTISAWHGFSLLH